MLEHDPAGAVNNDGRVIDLISGSLRCQAHVLIQVAILDGELSQGYAQPRVGPDPAPKLRYQFRLAWQVGGDAGSFVVPKSINNQMDQAQPPPVIP